MTTRIVRAAVVASIAAAVTAAAALFSPLAAQSGATACDFSAGHAMSVRRFLTSRVSLYSLQGEQLASVSRNDLSGVTTAIVCTNTTSYVKLDTQFGPRLARRSSLALGGGLGGPCRCPQYAGNEHASNSARNASSMGAGEGSICNADLPCTP